MKEKESSEILELELTEEQSLLVEKTFGVKIQALKVAKLDERRALNAADVVAWIAT